MVRAYFEQTKVTGEDHKSHTEWKQAYDGIAFRIDEGQMLESLAARSGQTTMTLLRSAWSGEQLGNSYADRDRRGFVLAGHAYRASLVMGVQPEHAGFLIDDAAGGTPQRFLWAALVDPMAPPLAEIASWPGALTWKPPDWRGGARVSIGGFERGAMTVAPSIVATMRQRRYDVTTGSVVLAELDSHEHLIQLKVAGLLAILDERLDVTEDDWRLAAIICKTSRRARSWVCAHAVKVAEAAETGSIQRSTRRAVAVEAARVNTPREIERIAAVIANAVARTGTKGITTGKLRASVAGRDRDLFGPALDNAMGRRLVVERDGCLIAKVAEDK
jgi:hypothetical protein